uniref:Secreted protein n=1 Tax=Ascaris lumbricoides TaxID=6252 RepID=A0A0M3HWK7_ASCLU
MLLQRLLACCLQHFMQARVRRCEVLDKSLKLVVSATVVNQKAVWNVTVYQERPSKCSRASTRKAFNTSLHKASAIDESVNARVAVLDDVKSWTKV